MSGINDWEPMAHVLRFCDGEKRVIEVLQFTRSFKVFKVMFNHRGGDHLLAPEVEVENIGDEALFLGYNHSISVLAPEIPWCQPNSIYYTNDFVTSIFNLDKGTSSTQLDSQTPMCGFVPPPLWIMPLFGGLRCLYACVNEASSLL